VIPRSTRRQYVRTGCSRSPIRLASDAEHFAIAAHHNPVVKKR